MVYKIFLPLFWVVFIFSLIVHFEFDKVFFDFVVVIVVAFGIISKNVLIGLISMNFFPMLSSRSLMVSGLVLWYFYYKSFLVVWYKNPSSLFCMCFSNCPRPPTLRQVFLYLLLNIHWLYIQGSVLGSLSCSLGPCICFCVSTIPIVLPWLSG